MPLRVGCNFLVFTLFCCVELTRNCTVIGLTNGDGRMAKPKIPQDNELYLLLREGRIDEFNVLRFKGKPCDLTGCDLRSLDLRGMSLDGLDFTDTYMRQADLRGLDFRKHNVSLAGASICDAKISGVYFPDNLNSEEIRLSLLYGTRMRVTKK